MNRILASGLLVGAVTVFGGGLAWWKSDSIRAANAASSSQPEPVESITAAFAKEREHRQAASAIGTVLALRSVTLRNELAGTVRRVNLRPGEIVEAGTVLVALDVSVEEAEQKAHQAQLALATATLARLERLRTVNATSEIEVDQARGQRDVAAAQIARTQAVIERKTIRVPFRARVGLADVHPGQFLNEGSTLTSLQSVDDALHVDFAVPQTVAASLRPGDRIDVFVGAQSEPVAAKVAALDARVDPATRNSAVRARIDWPRRTPVAAPTPGSSVRVSVAVGAASMAVAVPATALRKGPGGDHVFVIAPDKDGSRSRAQLRAVQVGATLGDEVLITGGLVAGEQVATSGSFKLRDAALVAVGESRNLQSKSRPAQPAHVASGS